MDSKVKICLERARNEIKIAETLFRLSEDSEEKMHLYIEEDMTFYLTNAEKTHGVLAVR